MESYGKPEAEVTGTVYFANTTLCADVNLRTPASGSRAACRSTARDHS